MLPDNGPVPDPPVTSSLSPPANKKNRNEDVRELADKRSNTLLNSLAAEMSKPVLFQFMA